MFHYRVNAGGSEVLLSGTVKTRDRLVDYFRYVEESVPFAKAAEARERGTATDQRPSVASHAWD